MPKDVLDTMIVWDGAEGTVRPETPLDDVAHLTATLDTWQGLGRACWPEGNRMADDIDGFEKWAKSQGWTVELDASGYRRFYASDGTFVKRYPATPGRAGRRFTELVIACRSYGLVWPAPSKKEQRSMRGKETS